MRTLKDNPKAGLRVRMRRLGGEAKGCVRMDMQPRPGPEPCCSMMAEAGDASGAALLSALSANSLASCSPCHRPQPHTSC